jgi:hypothetical protein
MTRRLFGGNIQDLDLFMEDMSEEDDEMKDSLFNRDDDDFTGIGTKGAGSN